jgi:hypothetical protein
MLWKSVQGIKTALPVKPAGRAIDTRRPARRGLQSMASHGREHLRQHHDAAFAEMTEGPADQAEAAEMTTTCAPADWEALRPSEAQP